MFAISERQQKGKIMTNSYNDVITAIVGVVVILVGANWVWTQIFSHLTQQLVAVV